MGVDARLRILHVIAGIDREGGGTTAAVLSLAAAQTAAGCDATILATDSGDPKSQGHLGGYDVAVRIVAATGSWRYSSELIGALGELLSRVDVVHVHGVWDFPPLAAMVAARVRGVPFVVSVHGVLSPEALRRSPLKKHLTRVALVDRLMRSANALVASGEHEARDLRSLNANVIVLPHGVAVADPQPKLPRDFGAAPKVGFLGRLHPFKGLDNLVDAVERLRGRWPGVTLELAGPVASGFESWADALTSSRPWVRRRGMVSGGAKSEFLREVDILVVASAFENFALVIGEALAYGTAVVTTERTSWTSVAERGVGVVCGSDVPSLQLGIGHALERSEVRERASSDGPLWIKSEFAWPRIARRSIAMYVGVTRTVAVDSTSSCFTE